MTQVVYRYPVEFKPGGLFSLEMPLGSRILHLEAQVRAPHQPSMWVLCDPDRESVERTFLIVGTGHRHENGTLHDHVGTCQDITGFVWHVFEVPDGKEIE